MEVHCIEEKDGKIEGNCGEFVDIKARRKVEFKWFSDMLPFNIYVNGILNVA